MVYSANNVVAFDGFPEKYTRPPQSCLLCFGCGVGSVIAGCVVA